MFVSRIRLVIVLAVALACVITIVLCVQAYEKYTTRKAGEMRLYLEARLRYARPEERRSLRRTLLKHIIDTGEKQEAAMALFQLIQMDTKAGTKDRKYSTNLLSKRFRGTAAEALYRARYFMQEGKYQQAATVLEAAGPFKRSPYDATYQRTMLLNLIYRKWAGESDDPRQAAQLYEKAIEVCRTLAVETKVVNDIGMAHLGMARAMLEKGTKFNNPEDVDAACELAERIKEIPRIKNPYAMYDGPSELLERARKWREIRR